MGTRQGNRTGEAANHRAESKLPTPETVTAKAGEGAILNTEAGEKPPGGTPVAAATPADSLSKERPDAAIDFCGVSIVFPENDHAALFALGGRIRDGKRLVPAELQRLFARFAGYVVIDATSGDFFDNLFDLFQLASVYYKDVVQDASRGKALVAHDVIEEDKREDWYRRALIEATSDSSRAFTLSCARA